MMALIMSFISSRVMVRLLSVRLGLLMCLCWVQGLGGVAAKPAIALVVVGLVLLLSRAIFLLLLELRLFLLVRVVRVESQGVGLVRSVLAVVWELWVQVLVVLVGAGPTPAVLT
jgi:hypothetical protein